MNDRVFQAVDLIRQIYEVTPAGGGMHVQLDDWNLEDDHFNKEYEQYLETEQERRCFGLMRGMSLAERASALGLERGYFKSVPEPDQPACLDDHPQYGKKERKTP